MLVAFDDLTPTMAARVNPQIWYTGSAVDQDVHEHGIVWARIRDAGVKGNNPRLAYFEWSIDRATPFDVTPEDAASEESWAQANPGLGIRISSFDIAIRWVTPEAGASCVMPPRWPGSRRRRCAK